MASMSKPFADLLIKLLCAVIALLVLISWELIGLRRDFRRFSNTDYHEKAERETPP